MMPTLQVRREKFGRYEPLDKVTQAICEVAKRQTLRRDDLEVLSDAGFNVEVE